MATVKLTGRIKDQIRNQIRTKFNARKTPLIQQVNSWGTEFYNVLVADDVQKNLGNVPGEFLHKADYLSMSMGGYGFQLPLGMERPVKAGWGRYSGTTLRPPVGTPFHDKVAAVVLQLQAIDAEEKTLVASIDRTMESCPNIKRLLEVWPTAVNYLDEETLKRHNTVYEKYDAPEVIPLDEDGKRLLAKTALLS